MTITNSPRGCTGQTQQMFSGNGKRRKSQRVCAHSRGLNQESESKTWYCHTKP